MRNFGPFFWFMFALLTPLAWTNPHAEVECSSEVFYTWTKNAEDTEQVQIAQGQEGSAGGAGAMPASGGAQVTPQGSPASTPVAGQVQTVRFFLVQRKGVDEAAAKNALQLEVQRQKVRAAERCKRAHESTGECLTTKLSIKSSTLNSLSFSARVAAEKALLEECQIQQGRCLSVDAASATCRDLSPPAPAVEASGAKSKGPAAPAKTDPKAKDAAGKAPPKKK